MKVKDDYFSLLHVLVSMLKETSESGKKRFKKTISVVLSSLKDLDIAKFKDIRTNRALKDELERIVQFLGITASDISFNLESQELYNRALKSVLDVMATQDLKTIQPRLLAFFMSAFGRVCLQDRKFTEMKEVMLKHIRTRTANIHDIVEALNASLILCDLTQNDLEKAGLDKDISFATSLNEDGNIVPILRFFEVLSSARLGSAQLWDAFFENIWQKDIDKFGLIDLRMISQIL